jgi:hypothetical protein
MLQEIIVLVFAYICLIGWLNAPKKTTEPETTEAPIAVQPAPQPKPITEPLPKPAYVAKPKAIAVPTAPKPETAPPAQDLSALPIRELYALAKARKLPRYKRLSKAALVEALS